ncbi:ASCH domain-containing protein [Vagococcus acidifermentans]
MLDGEGRLVCNVKVCDVEIKTYASITNEFAILEGDETLLN